MSDCTTSYTHSLLDTLDEDWAVRGGVLIRIEGNSRMRRVDSVGRWHVSPTLHAWNTVGTKWATWTEAYLLICSMAATRCLHSWGNMQIRLISSKPYPLKDQWCNKISSKYPLGWIVRTQKWIFLKTAKGVFCTSKKCTSILSVHTVPPKVFSQRPSS